MFSVALMVKMIALFAGLPRILSEGQWPSDRAFEYLNGVKMGLVVVLV